MVYMSKMDSDIQQQIRHEVVNAVAQSQNALMSQLKDLISNVPSASFSFSFEIPSCDGLFASNTLSASLILLNILLLCLNCSSFPLR
jgi:hypothetical protein